VSTTQTVLTVGDTHLMSALVGPTDSYLRRIEDAFVGTDVRVRGNEITVGGAEADRVAELFRSLIGLVSSGHHLDDATVARSIEMVRADVVPLEVFTTDVLRAPGGRIVRPKSAGQKRYVDAIADNVVTFGLGPAGTGKSWLAVATAVQALNE
jgi:phosphate starvation-inducible PhoH-like protein